MRGRRVTPIHSESREKGKRISKKFKETPWQTARCVVQCKRSQEESTRHQGWRAHRVKKVLWKKFQKPLDKSPKLWYNKGTKERGNQRERAVNREVGGLEAEKLFHSWLSTFEKKYLTNSRMCAIIKIQKARARQSQRERPTRVGKTFNPMTRPHGVPVCGIQMWTRPRRLKQCRGYAGYTSQALVVKPTYQ